MYSVKGQHFHSNRIFGCSDDEARIGIIIPEGDEILGGNNLQKEVSNYMEDPFFKTCFVLWVCAWLDDEIAQAQPRVLGVNRGMPLHMWYLRTR